MCWYQHGFCDEDLCLLGREQSSEHQQSRGWCAGAVGDSLANETDPSARQRSAIPPAVLPDAPSAHISPSSPLLLLPIPQRAYFKLIF